MIARKNLTRIDQLLTLPDIGTHIDRRHADPQIFVVDTGKTALTTLTNITSRDAALRLVPGEAITLQYEDNDVRVVDGAGRAIGQLEPQLAQRLILMTRGGNKYLGAIANIHGSQIKVLIREDFQAPEQRNMVSFPGKLGGDINTFRIYQRNLPSRYELEDGDLLEDDDLGGDDEIEPAEEDFFRGTATGDEEEVGLEELEADIKDDDDDDDEG